MIRLTGIKVPITAEQKEAIKSAIIKKLRIAPKELIDYKIFKQSIDARKKDMIYFVYSVDVEVQNEKKMLKKIKGLTLTTGLDYKYVSPGITPLHTPPIIVGTGPAGLFCGLILAEMGYKPLLLERGKDVDNRTKDVEDFWEKGKLNPESNVQFGEGGAGSFSDGKLTSLINNLRCRKVLETFVEHGGPEEILYSYKPHIGTDILKDVIKNIRKRIIELGGEVRFNSKVTDFRIEDGRIKGVFVNGENYLPSDVVVLAVGHSARDTFEVLNNKGVKLKPKPFAIGARIEHPQEKINKAQYGQFHDNQNLGAAEYKLVHHSTTGRTLYTFCMCPGGVVVSASSEENKVVTNGMSYHARDKENANSAILVGVDPKDFLSDHPLAGVEFQRKWEKLAFELAGGDYSAPVQLVGDFLKNRPSKELGNVRPSYKPGIRFVELKNCLPTYVIETMREGILHLEQKLKGFAQEDALITGVETRSSSPVRMERKDSYESINIEGLYPSGEGAGYAGGIVSAAVDGIMVAEAIASKFKNQ